MKSKVTFDLDCSNRSVIKAQITYSEDVRDKIATRFKERLGLSSNVAVIAIHPMLDGNVAELEIISVSGDESGSKEFTELLSNQQLTILMEAIKREILSRELSSIQAV